MSRFEEISKQPSYHWILAALALSNGLRVLLKWYPSDEIVNSLNFEWITINFSNPASWSHSSIAKMSQHPPDSPTDKLVSCAVYESKKSMSLDYTLSFELNSEWNFFRITAFDDVIDVISKDAPEVELHNNNLEIHKWLIAGWILPGM